MMGRVVVPGLRNSAPPRTWSLFLSGPCHRPLPEHGHPQSRCSRPRHRSRRVGVKKHGAVTSSRFSPCERTLSELLVYFGFHALYLPSSVFWMTSQPLPGFASVETMCGVGCCIFDAWPALPASDYCNFLTHKSLLNHSARRTTTKCTSTQKPTTSNATK